MKNLCILFLVKILLLVLLSNRINAQISKKYRSKIISYGEKVIVKKVINTQSLLVITEQDKKFRINFLGVSGVDKKLSTNIHVKFLNIIRNLVEGKIVYLMYDNEKMKKSGVLEAYIYYAKGFYLLNASLLKRGILQVDYSDRHWLKEEFQKLEYFAQKNCLGLWCLKFFEKKNKKIKKINSNISKIKKDSFLKKKNQQEKKIMKFNTKNLKKSEINKKTEIIDSKKYNLSKESLLINYNDPVFLAKVTAEFNFAKNDQKKINKILKKYQLVTQKEVNLYFEGLLKFSKNSDFISEMKRLLNNNK